MPVLPQAFVPPPVAPAGAVTVDEAEVRRFFELLHAHAAHAFDGAERPGMLQLSRLWPDDQNLVPTRFRIGNVEGMTEAAIADAAAGHNVYVEARTVGEHVSGRQRGEDSDTRGVFAFVVDRDADTGKAGIPMEGVSLTVESSPGNTHDWLFLERALSPIEAKALGDELRAWAGADSATGKPAQPYRVPGTPNYPDAKKRARGRLVAPTRIVSIGDQRWTADDISALTRTVSAASNGHAPAPGVEAALTLLRCPDWLRKKLAEPGDDRSDHLFNVIGNLREAGLTPEDALKLIRAHPDGVGEKYRRRSDLAEEVIRVWSRTADKETKTTAPPPAPIVLRTPAEWQGLLVPPMIWAADTIIPDRNVTMLSGDGGLGKTLLGQQLLASTVLDGYWLGFRTPKRNVLGIFCEDDDDELHRRFSRIAAHYKCELSDLDGLKFQSRVGEDNLLVTFDKQDRATPTRLYHDLTELAFYSGVRTILLDSLHDLFGGNEIIRAQARQFVGYLRRLAIRVDGAVVFNAHPSLHGMASGSGSSGSTGWHNTTRSRLYLTRSSDEGADDGARTLKTVKQNYGARGEGVELKWDDGVFVRVAAAGSDPFREAEAAFLDCLDRLTEQGRFVSVSPNSSTFAPKTFCRMPQARGCGRDKLHRAMDALFVASRIRIGEHRKANRHVIEVIMRAEQ